VIYMRGGVPSPLCIPQFWNSSTVNRQRYIPPPQPQPPTVPNNVNENNVVHDNVNDDVVIINDDDNDVNSVEPDDVTDVEAYDDDNEVQDVVIIISDEDD